MTWSRRHYPALGFELSAESKDETRWRSDLGAYDQLTAPIKIMEVADSRGIQVELAHVAV
jgi:hypothetical protein